MLRDNAVRRYAFLILCEAEIFGQCLGGDIPFALRARPKILLGKRFLNPFCTRISRIGRTNTDFFIFFSSVRIRKISVIRVLKKQSLTKFQVELPSIRRDN